MQRNVGHRDSTDQHRPQPADRGQLAGATDLDVDRLEHRLGALGGKLARKPPARRLRDEAEAFLPVEPVDLIDHPVDVVGQVRPLGADLGIGLQHVLERGAADEVGGDLEAPSRDPLHHPELRRFGHFARRAPAVRPETQRTRRGHARLLLPQRARRGVARVGELPHARWVEHLALGFGLCPRFFHQPRIERSKRLFLHVDFAAHLEHRGRLAGQLLRDIRDMPHVGGDVLADLPVAARRRAHQHAVLIAQRARQAVDLVLGGERDRLVLRPVQVAAHPRNELGDLLVGEGVVEAHHADFVHHFAQRRSGDLVPDLARGRIRPHQMRERRLELGVAPHQRVVLGVGYLRRILDVIEPVVPRDLAREPHQLVGGLGFGQFLRGRDHAAGGPAPCGADHSARIRRSESNRHSPSSKRIA